MNRAGRRAVRPDALEHAVYVSGDTVWYEGVAEVARRFHVTTAFLFLGAARVQAVGPAHLTFTAEEAVEAVRAFDDALVAHRAIDGPCCGACLGSPS